MGPHLAFELKSVVDSDLPAKWTANPSLEWSGRIHCEFWVLVNRFAHLYWEHLTKGAKETPESTIWFSKAKLPHKNKKMRLVGVCLGKLNYFVNQKRICIYGIVDKPKIAYPLTRYLKQCDDYLMSLLYWWMCWYHVTDSYTQFVHPPMVLINVIPKDLNCTCLLVEITILKVKSMLKGDWCWQAKVSTSEFLGCPTCNWMQTSETPLICIKVVAKREEIVSQRRTCWCPPTPTPK